MGDFVSYLFRSRFAAKPFPQPSNASGTVKLGQYSCSFSVDKDMGVLDLGRGYWPDHNVWYWGSASGRLDGHSLGWNIGFGNLSNATENAIIYDGKVHKFDRIDSFDIPAEGNLARSWHIVSNDGRFDMQFVPLMDRKSEADLTCPGPNQHQVFGYYNGKAVLDDGTENSKPAARINQKKHRTSIGHL